MCIFNLKVLFYIPNIVGYVRILLLLVSFYVMQSHPKVTIVLYLSSWFLDAVDGYAARCYNQSSKFGWVLDLVTDKMATACLITCLTKFYSEYMFLFQMWLIIDIYAHWMYQIAMALSGKTSHKGVGSEVPILVRFFYQSRTSLFIICSASEIFFATLYLRYFFDNFIVNGVLYFTLPIMLFKTTISLMHLKQAVKILSQI